MACRMLTQGAKGMKTMLGRFSAWCLFIGMWLIVLGGCYFLLDQVGLSGWRRFVVLIPVLIAVRFSVQRFLGKGKRHQSE